MFDGDTSHELNDIEISSTDVLNKILILKNGKAPGDDVIRHGQFTHGLDLVGSEEKNFEKSNSVQ